MTHKSRLLLLCLVFFQISAHADSLQDTLAQKYKKHVLALRSPFPHGDMKFDSDGHSLNPPLKDRWLLYSGIYIEKLSVSQDTLHVEGPLAFLGQEKRKGKPVVVKLSKTVRVEIKLTQPLQSLEEAEAVLDRVFFLDEKATEHTYLEFRRFDFSPNEPLYHVAKDEVKPPRATFTPEPEYSEQARHDRFQGIVVLGIVVDKAGNVVRVRLVRALGQGLDQNAMERVTSWRFEPATRKGEPVAVEMNIEVSFNLY